ncbi:histidinol dehydrogenase [Paradevosia shaoguanensis]|uniref:Histidinol dehydrogenase n=1 Tax=Paradevosia shaoguanensis TaxID=1335043 RepID=A0AA41QJU5_9HYPH|nr:histidinol dehydrogenase [Paradevosia shaoguanensis]MCF1741446.1 histidinol dehydrogenase [Paradevosia shaoguanensis]MCI0125929.1 histidinol dehydrogenase [Paradevosia shaoguanensis]
MPSFLDTRDADFAARFQALLEGKRESSQEVGDTVAGIIADVRARGDEALVELTNKFDKANVTAETLRFTEAEIEEAAARVTPDVRSALETAHARIKAHHEKQKPVDHIYTDEIGVTLGTRWTAIEAVGIYVPGGLASYPSSVLMNAVPAKVAGVERIAMVVPTPRGEINAAILAAAKIAGVTEIYRVGGAQAVAALAYGTRAIAPVDKIMGPGNAYVAAAKRQVFGKVGIDMIAGPSEVLVIADSSANPAWVAADLLAQAEHGAGAQSILVTTDPRLADAVAREVDRQLAVLPREKLTREGWEEFGAIITVASLDEAVELANRIASEHVELAVDDPKALMPLIRNAGAIFLGHHTPEAIGDYVGGSNHVLPTARSARFASGLGVLDFVKRTSVLGCDPSSLAILAPAAVTLAETEALDAHGRSVSIRLNR